MDNEDIEYLKLEAGHGRIFIYDGQSYIDTILGYATILEFDMRNGQEFSSDEIVEYIQAIKNSAIRYKELMNGCIDQLKDYQKKSRGE